MKSKKEVKSKLWELYNHRLSLRYKKHPLQDRDEVKLEFDKDIEDPSICGCKEQKIAILLWVLHENSKKTNKFVKFFKTLFNPKGDF